MCVWLSGYLISTLDPGVARLIKVFKYYIYDAVGKRKTGVCVCLCMCVFCVCLCVSVGVVGVWVSHIYSGRQSTHFGMCTYVGAHQPALVKQGVSERRYRQKKFFFFSAVCCVLCVCVLSSHCKTVPKQANE